MSAKLNVYVYQSLLARLGLQGSIQRKCNFIFNLDTNVNYEIKFALSDVVIL